MKNCSNKNCQQSNPQSLECFKTRTNGKPKSWCKSCDETYSKSWKKSNKDKVANWNATAAKNWRAANPDKYKGTNLKRYWPGLSGLESLQEYNKLLQLQNNKCSICLKDQSELSSALCVDHCHSTNKVRGLLCDKCNQAIGLLDDNSLTLLRAAKYLE